MVVGFHTTKNAGGDNDQKKRKKKKKMENLLKQEASYIQVAMSSGIQLWKVISGLKQSVKPIDGDPKIKKVISLMVAAMFVF